MPPIKDFDQQIADHQTCGNCLHRRDPNRKWPTSYLICDKQGRRVQHGRPGCEKWEAGGAGDGTADGNSSAENAETAGSAENAENGDGAATGGRSWVKPGDR